jgi:3-dehydroquinate synthase
MQRITIALPDRPYDIVIAQPLVDGHAAELTAVISGRHCLVVTDSNVGPLYADAATQLLRSSGAIQVDVVSFPAGEQSKNLDTVARLYKESVQAGLDRSSTVVALGGGVVGDTAGFLAATYMRGIELVQMPTSLLAHVDSSVGGKTGVDLDEGKNLVGAFHQPQLVLSDVTTLNTLDDRQLRCGLAEVVKYGVILDAEFFSWLEDNVSGLLQRAPEIYSHVIGRSCQLKAEIVLEDERDLGRRAVLNYGHTFGHALEKLAGYSFYTHGEAIAIGMGMAADLAAALTPCPELDELCRRQDALFTALGLPLSCSRFAPADIAAAMKTDKKYVAGSNRLILPERIGRVDIIGDVPDAPILAAIEGRCDH